MTGPERANAKAQLMSGVDEREADVMAEVRKGTTYQKVADMFGLASKQSVWKIVKRVRERNQDTADNAWQLMREEQDRDLSELRDKLVAKLDDDPEDRLQIIDRILKVQDRQAKLWGLDAPTRTEQKMDVNMSHEEILKQLK